MSPESSPASQSNEQYSSADQARRALEQRRMNLMHDSMTLSIDMVYESGSMNGGRALERARGVIEQQGVGESIAFSAAQRQVELTLESNEWTDEIREAAVNLNRERRRLDGGSALSFDQAIAELKNYQEAWKDGAKRDGDEWLDNQANALGYNLRSASRGDVEGINGALSHIEGMLKGTLNNTDTERGADELRDLRDALFMQKQALKVSQEQNERDQAQSAQREPIITQARHDVEAVFSEPQVPEVTAAAAQHVPVDTYESAEQKAKAALRAFDELPAEEKEFRNRLAQVKNTYGVSTAQELGFTKDILAELDEARRGSLTGVFDRYNRERLRHVGDQQVIAAKQNLIEEIREILHGQPREVVDLPTIDTAVVEDDLQINNLPETVVDTADEIQEISAAPETPEVIRKIDGATSDALVRMVGSYFGGASSRQAREVIQAIAAEQDIDSQELFNRLRNGDVSDTAESQQAVAQLMQKGARANSLVWGNMNQSSELGRTAAESHMLLEQAIRSLLS